MNSDTSEEFSIEEYDIKDMENEGSAIKTSKIIGDGVQKQFDCNNVIPTSIEEEKCGSPMHIR